MVNLRRLLVCTALLALLGCGGQPPEAPEREPTLFLRQQLAALGELEAPAGVDAAVWSQLKSNLRDLLSTPGSAKVTLAAPNSTLSAPVLGLDGLSLNWQYFNQGDYDQNSEVNIGDLTPLGLHFGETSGGGPFPVTSVQSAVDGDNNGEINLADLTPIGANFGRRVGSYNIYQSLDPADAPATADEPSSIEPLASLNFDAATGVAAAARLDFAFTLAEVKQNWFYWVRPADEPEGAGNEGIVSSIVQAEASEDNTPPTAGLTATPPSGDIPLSVHLDAAASTDVEDGETLTYQWDFEGDGVIDAETAGTDNVDHSYAEFGEFNATVLVTDTGGLVGTASTLVTCTVAGNNAPQAELEADLTDVDPETVVTFDATASSDPDADTLNFTWDFDGDGSSDLDTGAIPTAAFAYPAGGSFTAEVTVKDGKGGEATASIVITVNHAPVALLETDVTSGNRPLTVLFSFGGSADADGDPLVGDFDLEGDGIPELSNFSISPASQVSRTYETAGNFTASLVVREEGGTLESAPSTVDIQVIEPSNLPPVAALELTPQAGDAPLTVSFDASGSSDPDGQIVFWRYDVNGDGVFDVELDSAAEASFSFDMALKMDAMVTLEVEDNLGATDTATERLRVNSGFVAVELFAEQPGFLVNLAAIRTVASSSVFLQAVYLTSDGVVRYVRSDLDDPTVWSPPVEVTDKALGGAGTAGLSLLNIGGNPAIAFRRAGVNQVLYQRATTSSGTTWGAPVVALDPGYGPFGVDLAIIGGNPAVSAHSTGTLLTYARASDSTGTLAWGAPVTVETRSASTDLNGLTSLLTVAGRPAVIWAEVSNFSTKAFYERADNATGTAWNGSVVQITTQSVSNDEISAALLSGNPALLFPRGGGGRLARALDSSGAAWPAEGLVIAPHLSSRNVSLGFGTNLPAAAYEAFGLSSAQGSTLVDLVMYLDALDSAGAAWSPEMFVFASPAVQNDVTDMVLVSGPAGPVILLGLTDFTTADETHGLTALVWEE